MTIRVMADPIAKPNDRRSGILDWIERVGNLLPDPVTLFVIGAFPDTVVSAAEPSDIADAIVRSITSKHAGFGDTGRAYIRQYYDWGQNLSEIDRLLASAQALEARDKLTQEGQPEGLI